MSDRTAGKARSGLRRALTHRFSIAGLNALIMLILGSAVLELAHELGAGQHPEEALKVIEGLATILIGYGVVVEERHFLMTKLGLYPALETPEEEETDELCHGVGYAALVLGLLAETLVKLVEMPNSVVNTEGLDTALLAGAGLVLAGCFALLGWHSIRLLSGPKAR